MAISQVIWSLEDKVQLQPAELTSEKELEDLLAEHIEILNPDWLLVGRQVRTVAGKYIDLLCMDHDGDLVVVELKKDLTPREVTAQAIDYASCMADLTLEELAEQYLQFSDGQTTLNEAYEKKYGTVLDDSTERIIRYLREKYEVDINIMFFHVVCCGTKRLISRAWFEEDVEEQRPDPKSIRQWNQEYYVSFGSGERSWVDAQKYGFISAGGGAWYSNTLKLLSPGDRVWVNIPHTGYVGVGIVRSEVQQAKDVRFTVDGQQVGFSSLQTQGDYLYSNDDPVNAEYVVLVDWLKTIPEAQAVREIGFFGNQNSVCRPRDQKWVYTVERLKKIWGIEP